MRIEVICTGDEVLTGKIGQRQIGQDHGEAIGRGFHSGNGIPCG